MDVPDLAVLDQRGGDEQPVVGRLLDERDDDRQVRWSPLRGRSSRGSSSRIETSAARSWSWYPVSPSSGNTTRSAPWREPPSISAWWRARLASSCPRRGRDLGERHAMDCMRASIREPDARLGPRRGLAGPSTTADPRRCCPRSRTPSPRRAAVMLGVARWSSPAAPDSDRSPERRPTRLPGRAPARRPPVGAARAPPFDPMRYPTGGPAPCDEAASDARLRAVSRRRSGRIAATDRRTVVFELCDWDVAFLTKVASPAWPSTTRPGSQCTDRPGRRHRPRS